MRHLPQHINPGGTDTIDPRISLIGAFFLLTLVVSSGGIIFSGLVSVICLAGTMILGMALRQLTARMLHPLLLMLAILLIKSFSGISPSVLITLPLADTTLNFHPAGFNSGMTAAARILGAVSIVLLLGHIMSFTGAMAALAWFRVPRGLIEVALFAWRALFMLYDSAGTVYTAQKNRLGYSGIRRGLRSFGTMAGLLTIRAFDTSHAMTVAMTQRGYDGSLPMLQGAHLRRSHLGGLLIVVLCATAAWTLQNWP